MSTIYPLRSNSPTLGLLASLLLMALISGCKKPDDDLGLELLPGDPMGLATDTAALHAYTYLDNAIQTSGLSRNLVGAYTDPVFGVLKTSLVAQLRLTSNNIGQGLETSGLVPDSIVLALAFETPNTHYGNLNRQRFVVQELATALSADTVYRSDRQPDVIADDLVLPHRGEITPSPYTNVIIGDDTLVPQIRLPLKISLAQRILNEFGHAPLADNSAFTTFFKGIKVSVDNGMQAPYEGGVFHINTTGGNTKVTLYYHDLLNEPDRQRTLDLVTSSTGVRYTSAERDVSLALAPELTEALNDTISPTSSLYLQTLGGYRNAIRFPDLTNFAGEGKALSKAELVVPVRGSYYPYYTPPTTLLLFRRSAGSDMFLPDQLSGVTGIGGEFNTAEQAYRFNITRYANQVLNGTLPDTGIELVAGSSGVSANRVVLCGPGHPTTPMRLLLTFTTY